MYHPFIEAVALTIVDVPITFVTIMIFSIILYFMVGLRASASQFFTFFLFIFTVALEKLGFPRHMMDQVVLATIDEALAPKLPSLWIHPLLIPSYLALLSILVLLVQAILSSGPVRRLHCEYAPVAATCGDSGVTVSATRTSFMSAVKVHVENAGGLVIFTFQVLRLLVVLVLLGLAIFSSVREEGQQHVSPLSAVSALNGRDHKGKRHYGGDSLTK
ncbi:hypothetical protein H4582DRAFT_2200970 [Lactarius indigo]|nr:hypothetical protein H4582DRAFT_2200970 [Lactarius indigo]